MKRSPLKRTGGLKAGASVLKRTRIRARSAKVAAAVAAPSALEVAGRTAWHYATLADPLCASCGRAWAIHGHHVVRAQDVRKFGGDVWDLRNRMSVCTECHLNHHHGSYRQRLTSTILTFDNLLFMRELLGDQASEYIAKHYRRDTLDAGPSEH